MTKMLTFDNALNMIRNMYETEAAGGAERVGIGAAYVALLTMKLEELEDAVRAQEYGDD